MKTTSREIGQRQIRNRESLLAARVRKAFNSLHPLHVGDIVRTADGYLGEYHGISARKPGYVTVMLYNLGGRVVSEEEVKDTIPRRIHSLGIEIGTSFYPRPNVPESWVDMDHREINPLRPQPRDELSRRYEGSVSYRGDGKSEASYPSRPAPRPDPLLRQLGDKSSPRRVVLTPQPKGLDAYDDLDW